MSADTEFFTVLGAHGFIGAALVAWLESQDHVVHAITRASLPALLAARRPAGHVIDCVGLTGDFRERPLETAEAHVGLVARCLSEMRFDSFLLREDEDPENALRAFAELPDAYQASFAEPQPLFRRRLAAGQGKA